MSGRFGAGQEHPMLTLAGTYTAEQIANLLQGKASVNDVKILFEMVSQLRKELDTMRKEMNR